MGRPVASGNRASAHQTASGKMLLACLPAEARPGIDFTGVTPKTRYSITSQQGLDRELQRIRETGLATTREEYYLGSMSMAVQVGTADHATTALSLWGAVERMRQAEIVVHLRQGLPCHLEPRHSRAPMGKPELGLSSRRLSPVPRRDSTWAGEGEPSLMSARFLLQQGVRCSPAVPGVPRAP
ncbi:hypothetical protein GS438_02670 [Rhodococcus hoagii]|nr:hypothetical protein [Prescottella equi]